eukprot:5665554-Amphidinium_carterae.2
MQHYQLHSTLQTQFFIEAARLLTIYFQVGLNQSVELYAVPIGLKLQPPTTNTYRVHAGSESTTTRLCVTSA